MEKEHSLSWSVFLHLFPGVLITLFFVLVAPILQQAGLPSVVGILLAIVFVLIPFQLGAILISSKRVYGSYSLKSALLYTRPMPRWTFGFLVLVLFLWSGISLMIASFIDEPIIRTFFSWLPEWFFMNEDFSVYSHSILVPVIVVMFFLNGLIGPIVEELYFRGFLLPRISRMKNAAPILNAVLFSLYHFFTPWQNIGRIIGLIPICYAVFKKKNIYIGIAVHCMGNIFATLSMLAFL